MIRKSSKLLHMVQSGNEPCVHGGETERTRKFQNSPRPRWKIGVTKRAGMRTLGKISSSRLQVTSK